MLDLWARDPDSISLINMYMYYIYMYMYLYTVFTLLSMSAMGAWKSRKEGVTMTIICSEYCAVYKKKK